MRRFWLVALLAGCFAALPAMAQNPIKYAKDRTEAAQDDYLTDDAIDAAADPNANKREARSYEDMKHSTSGQDFKNMSKDFDENDTRKTTPDGGVKVYEANKRAEALERLQAREAEEKERASRLSAKPAGAKAASAVAELNAVPLEKRLQEIVQAYDKDGDGTLSESEKEAVRAAIRERFGDPAPPAKSGQ